MPACVSWNIAVHLAAVIEQVYSIQCFNWDAKYSWIIDKYDCSLSDSAKYSWIIDKYDCSLSDSAEYSWIIDKYDCSLSDSAEYSCIIDKYDCSLSDSTCCVTYNVSRHFAVQAMKRLIDFYLIFFQCYL